MLVAESAERIFVHDQRVHLRVQRDVGRERARDRQRAGPGEARLRPGDLTSCHGERECVAPDVDRLRSERFHEPVRGIRRESADRRAGEVLQTQQRLLEPDRVAQAFGQQRKPDDPCLVETRKQLSGQIALHDLLDQGTVLARDEERRLQGLEAGHPELVPRTRGNEGEVELPVPNQSGDLLVCSRTKSAEVLDGPIPDDVQAHRTRGRGPRPVERTPRRRPRRRRPGLHGYQPQGHRSGVAPCLVSL